MAYIPAAGRSQVVAISTTSAKTALISGSSVYITPTVDCFMRAGDDPTALADGTDYFMLANCTQEFDLRPNVDLKIAFITASGSGSAYVSVAK
jgi:hypothetical protein